MPRPLISGGQLLSLLVSYAHTSHCLGLLVRVVDWYVSQFVRLSCYKIILTASNSGTHDFYSRGCNVFTCKKVLYTGSYNFYTRGCDVFTCKNFLNTRSFDFYTRGCDVFTCKNVLNTRSYKHYTCECNVFTCKNILYTLWYNLIPIVGTNFYCDNQSLARANCAVVTNNLTMIIEVVLIDVLYTVIKICSKKTPNN